MNAKNVKTPLWNKGFTCMFVSRFFASCGFMMYTTNLASYAMDELGVSAGSAGLAISIFTIGILVSRLFAGRYLDVLGRRRMTVLGGALCVLTAVCYLLPFGFPSLVGTRLVHGLAYGTFTNTTMVIAAVFIPRERLGEGLGILSLTATLAIAIGPLAGTLAIQLLGYTAMFMVGIVFALISLAFACIPEIEELPASPQDASDVPLFDRFFSRQAIPISILVGIASICISCPNSFVSAFCAESGFSEGGSLYFIVYSLVMCVTRPIMGRLVDERGDNVVVYPSLALFTGAFVMLGLGLGLPGVIAAAVLIGLGYGGLFPSYQFIVTRRADNATLGVVTSTFFILSDVGLSLGPVLGGIAVSLFGYVGMFAACVPVALLMSLLYFVFHGRHASRGRQGGGGSHE